MAENNRVLNFSEFGKKYSQESAQDVAASYSEFAKSSDNFQEGFDEDTYEEGQSGPKRPISSGLEETPSHPGEESSPNFSSDAPEGMEAPEDVDADSSKEDDIDPEQIINDDSEEKENDDSEETEDWDDYGNPEGEEEEDDDEDEDDEEDDEDDEEDTSESLKNSFVLESFDDFTLELESPKKSGYDDVLNSIELEDDEMSMEFDEDEEDVDLEFSKCMVKCKECGSEKLISGEDNPFGEDSKNDPDSWWQGSEMGMNCGCNM